MIHLAERSLWSTGTPARFLRSSLEALNEDSIHAVIRYPRRLPGPLAPWISLLVCWLAPGCPRVPSVLQAASCR